MSEGDDPDASQAMVDDGGSEPNGRARPLSRAESLDVRFPWVVPLQKLGSSPRRMYRICTRDIGSIRYKAVSVVTASVINTRVTCICFATLPGFFACRVECSVTGHACIPETARSRPSSTNRPPRLSRSCMFSCWHPKRCAAPTCVRRDFLADLHRKLLFPQVHLKSQHPKCLARKCLARILDCKLQHATLHRMATLRRASLIQRAPDFIRTLSTTLFTTLSTTLAMCTTLIQKTPDSKDP